MDFDLNDETMPEHSLQDALESLSELKTDVVSLPAPVLYGLSDILDEETSAFWDVWASLPDDTRVRCARILVDTSESNFEFQYRQVALALLNDPSPQVRQAAIELLWEDETLDVMDRLLDLLQRETADLVRAEIMNALGRFVLLGEYGDIPQRNAVRVQEAVYNVWHSDNEGLMVRRRALEAISNSSRSDVRDIIQTAYRSEYPEMQVSAIHAMGRSCDSYWADSILEEIENSDPERQYEAVRASGDLELGAALSKLVPLAYQSNDRELQEMAIWAMGEIGGDEAVSYLQQLADSLEDSDDSDLVDALDEAVRNAEMRLDLPDLDNSAIS
jgi:HEAT repeat protein